MVKERYVSSEVAKLLKDKGFNEDYPKGDCTQYGCTQQMACDWIEEQYGIFIQINRYHPYYEGREVIAVTKEDKERGHMTMYYARIFDKHSASNTTEHYDSIESAYNEALKHILTNMI